MFDLNVIKLISYLKGKSKLQGEKKFKIEPYFVEVIKL